MAAAPALFDWNGFNTFILDASLPNNNKEQIIKIFANKLYECTSVNNYYFRLLKAYITYLANKNTTNTFKASWDNFVSNMTTKPADIKEIAIKLLVLVQNNTDYTKTPNTISISDIYDNTKPHHIDSINTTDTFTPIHPSTTNATAKQVADTILKVDTLVPVVEKVVKLFDWKDFTGIFTGVSADDARKYICEYFISELAEGKIKNANQYTDAFILLMHLIKKNVKIEGKVNDLSNAVTNDNTNALINNIAKALHILFEITELEKNIGAANANSLKIFVNELTGLVPKKTITFVKTKLPAGWKNYELLNVLSYDVSINKDTATPANDDVKYGNILTFLNTISTPVKAPAANFKPNIIALQNTSGIQASKTYTTTEKAIIGNGYAVDTSTEAITFIHTDTNKSGSGNLPGADNYVFYQYSFNATKQYLIVNIISKCDDKGDKKAISIAAIIDGVYPIIHKQIKYEPNQIKCLLIISGKIDKISELDKELVTKKSFRKVSDYVKYKNKLISDIHIYTTNLGTQSFDIFPIDNNLRDDKKYSVSVPFGIRLFLSTEPKHIDRSKPKHTGPITMQNMHKVLADELDSMDIGALKKLLASISPPNYGDKKKKTSSKTPGKATPAAATPAAATPAAATPAAATPAAATAGKNVQTGAASKLKSIDLAAAKQQFDKDKKKNPPVSIDYTIFTAGSIDTAAYPQVLIVHKGKEQPKKIKVKYDASQPEVDGLIMGKQKGPYNLQFTDYNGITYNIHNLHIYEDKKHIKYIYFQDTSHPTSGNPKIYLTTYAQFH